MLFCKKILNKNASWKIQVLLPYFKKKEKVLDFGCGDLTLSRNLKERNVNLDITGVDVIDLKEKQKKILYIKYSGGKLPFRENSFDTVFSVYVFHHCKDASACFLECVRVAKKRVIFIEAIATNSFVIPFMIFIDWLLNIWKPEAVPLTYQFYSLNKWKDIFKENNLIIRRIKEINTLFSFLSIGKAYLFEVYKK